MTRKVGAEVAVLSGLHRTPHGKVAGAAGAVIGGLLDALACQSDLHGLNVKSFIANSCTHFGHKGHNQIRAVSQAAGWTGSLEKCTAHTPVGEDLGPGVISSGQSGLQRNDILAQVGRLAK